MAVVELGMSAPGEIRTLLGIAEPDVRVWTNVAEAHLEHFPSVEAIADAKAEILEGADADDVLVANAGDARVMARASRFAGRTRDVRPRSARRRVGDATSNRAASAAWPPTSPRRTARVRARDAARRPRQPRQRPRRPRRRPRRRRPARRDGGARGDADPAVASRRSARRSPPASPSSTTPTTPTRSRSSARSTCSAPRPAPAVASPSSARCSSSAPKPRRCTRASAAPPRAPASPSW